MSESFPTALDRILEGLRRPPTRYVGTQPNSTGAIRPVYRLPAWRVPNEDGAAVDIQFQRAETAILAPLLGWTRELLERGPLWDACTAPSDDGSRRVMLERERMAKVDADLRAEGFGRVDPNRRPWLGWCLK